jgi:rhodanese-related sulfurtransferase
MAKKVVPQKKTNNKPITWVVVLLAIAVLAVSGFMMQQNSAVAAPAEVSVAQAAEMRDAGVFVLDVREQEEWNQVHIPDATLIPLGELPTRLSELPKDQEILVVCRSGNRSATARDILRNNGFENSTSMAGGMNQWQAAGYPTVSGP